MKKIIFTLAAPLLIAFTIIFAHPLATQTAHATNGVPFLHITVNEPDIQAVQLSFHDLNGNQVNPCVLLTNSSRPNTEINYAVQPNATQWIGVYAFTFPINQSSPCSNSPSETYSRVTEINVGSSDVTVTI